jgi:tetratricopeptide (TPR) repeat protein
MSLLLEALKKAEKAKEEAQRRAKGDVGVTTAELRLDTNETAPREKPVMTRAELPDIRQPLEILSDEIAPATESPAASPAQRPAEAQLAERTAARKVFEAKFKEPNPRLPFFLALGVLSAFAVGTVGYFWYQLRPPPPLVNANPVRATQEAAAAAPEFRPAAPVVLSAAPAAIPGLPPTSAPASIAAAPKSAPEVSAAPKPAAQARVVAPVLRPATSRPAAASVAPTRRPPQVHPKVESAYAAYLAGDLQSARTDYQAALREDAGNRDALLGLAAIDVRSNHYERAEGAYLRLLQADPRDSHAQAALIALRASRLDPLATESRVKSLLAADPDAEALHFTLGNQLAQQSRWAEAQQQYFKAFAADPDNADFAYNLAVSLDHLRQSKLALDYYRRAITLADKRGAAFDVAAARNRAAQLAN